MVLLSGLLLAGCGQVEKSEPFPPETSAPSETPINDEQEAMNELMSIACQTFFGDENNYQYSVSQDLLSNAGSAKYDNIQDPALFDFTIESMNEIFDETEEAESSDKLINWLKNEAIKGKDADLDAFESDFNNLAAGCSDYSVAADWIDFDESDKPGTKPATLVCSEIFNMPMTLKVYYNQNVLTSNMFKDAGLHPRDMSNADKDQLERTRDYLTEQAELVDDDAVRDGLLNIRKPYDNALDNGNYWSDGMDMLLDPLEDACIASGYDLVQ